MMVKKLYLGKFTEYQKKVKEAVETHRITAFIGGIRSGKTWIGSRILLQQALAHPYWLLWVIAPDYGRTMPAENEIFNLLHRNEIPFKTNRKYFTRIQLQNGSVIEFRTAANPDALRGHTPDFIWIDEAAYLPSTLEEGDTIDVILGRLSKPHAKLLITTTPAGRNWLYYKIVEPFQRENAQHIAVITASTYDNPNLPEDYLKMLEKNYSGAWRRQEMLGEFVDIGGLVFPYNFDEYMVEEIPEQFDYVVGGMDWGSVAPSVFLFIGVKDDKVYVFDEFYRAGIAIPILKEALRNYLSRYPHNQTLVIYADPTIPFLSEWVAENLPVRKVPKREPIATRLLKIINLMDNKRIFFTSKVPNLIREMKNLMWEDGEKMIVREGQDDHAIDALGYALTNLHIYPLPQEKKEEVPEWEPVIDERELLELGRSPYKRGL